MVVDTEDVESKRTELWVSSVFGFVVFGSREGSDWERNDRFDLGGLWCELAVGQQHDERADDDAQDRWEVVQLTDDADVVRVDAELFAGFSKRRVPRRRVPGLAAATGKTLLSGMVVEFDRPLGKQEVARVGTLDE